MGVKRGRSHLRVERRLRVLENRVLRRILEPKRDEVTGEWEKLHNEELNDLYPSPNIIRVNKSRRMRWVGHVALMETGEVHIGFWWGSLRKEPLDKPRRRREYRITMDLQEVG
jgi:hypothetical protein